MVLRQLGGGVSNARLFLVRFGDIQKFLSIAIGLLLVALLSAALSGCGSRRDESNQLSKRVVEYGQPVPKGGGSYKTGKPYQIKGRWYKPGEQPGYDRTGIASWYGDLFHGRYTANGEIFDMDRLSAAHPTLPLPVLVKVSNLSNGRSIVVRVNDRGPYAHNRIIDLSRQSARALGFERKGTAPVRVEVVGKAPMNGDDAYERRFLASQSWARAAYAGLDPQRSERPVRAAMSRPAAVQSAPAPKLAQAAADQMVTASIAPSRLPQPMTVGTPPEDELPAQRLPAPGFYVQAGSFRDRDNADKARGKLGALGDVSIDPIQVRNSQYYRVRLGPYASRGAASAALGKARRQGYRGTVVAAD